MKIHQHLTANEEYLTPFPFKRELSMESYLIENEKVLSLDNDRYSDVQVIEEELTLKQGRSSKETDGRIDILATYSNEHIAVIELKLGELKEIHLTQLEDYLNEKEQLLAMFPNILDNEATNDAKWIGVLVGSSISNELRSKISNGYTTNNGIPIAALEIQRYRSDRGIIFVTTNVVFKDMSNNKDNSKYIYENHEYGKGKIVHKIIKSYVEANQNITFAELEKVFPKHLQGSSGVFSTIEQATDIETKTTRRRHFLKPDEQIILSDSIIAVSSQWGIKNINNFIIKAKEIGFNIGIKK